MQTGGDSRQISWHQYAGGVAILLLAAALRIPGVSPDIAAWHPDEYNFVFWPLLILLGEQTPPVFYYPHLSYYVLAAINAIHLGLAGMGDSFAASTLLRYFWYPEQSLAIARAFGVACAVATVGVTGLLARRLGANGLLAAGLMAVCVIHVRQSPVAGADVPMTLSLCWPCGRRCASNRQRRHVTICWQGSSWAWRRRSSTRARWLLWQCRWCI